MRSLLFSTLLTASLALSSCAEAGPTSDLSKAEIEEIVKAYIIENPEIIRDAIFELQQRELEEQNALRDQSTYDAIEQAKSALFDDPRDVSIGPDNAKVTIVEFFDYNCGYCKRATPWVEQTIEKYGKDVRVIFKELPILEDRTKTSRDASKAALAAARQGKYSAMHFALMKETRLSSAKIREVANEIGLNIGQFDADLADPSIDAHIGDTLVLAEQIPALTGTPFFIINDSFVSGANTPRLQELIEEGLQN